MEVGIAIAAEKKMPSRKPRAVLTLPDDLNALLDQVSDYQGTPKNKINN